MKKRTLSLLVLIPSLVAFFQCSNNEQSQLPKNNLALGKQLLVNNCGACHNLPTQSNTGIAPSFLSIQDAYKSINKEEFTTSMIDFLNSPSIEKSKMKKSVIQYGLMPKMGFSETDLALIVQYLHESDLENEKLSQNPTRNIDETDLEKGKNIALKTKSILGKNLMQAVKQRGPDGAVEFCNERAILLTDSMGNELKSVIKRVTDKPRNPLNNANEMELTILELLKLDENKQGIIKEHNGKKIGYFKIETNEMCMKCHGDLSSDISTKTANRIAELYTSDKATGYKPNQLRGMWVVEIPSK